MQSNVSTNRVSQVDKVIEACFRKHKNYTMDLILSMTGSKYVRHKASLGVVHCKYYHITVSSIELFTVVGA